jgi:hypothetical protein
MDTRITGSLAIVGVYLLLVAVVGFTAPGVADVDANPGVGGPTLAPNHQNPTGSLVKVDRYGREEWNDTRWTDVFGVDELPNGSVLVAFQNVTDDCGTYQAPCGYTGVEVHSQPPGDREWRWAFKTPEEQANEMHDAEYNATYGEISMIDMAYERLVVVDYPSGDIEYQWNASSFYTPPEDALYRDWLHMNDVDRLGEDRWLISVRNANQLLIVERGEDVVEVINKDRDDSNDGDCRGPPNKQLVGEEIRCGDPLVMDHQHDPQWLSDGRVLVADSEKGRIVELERQGGQWVPVWSDEGAGHMSYQWPRDANRLPNGHTVVADTRNNRILQIDADKDLVWEVPVAGSTYASLRNGTELRRGLPGHEGVESRGLVQPIGVISTVHGAARHVGLIPRWFNEWLSLGAVFVAFLNLCAVCTVGVERFWPR